jgi:hypothetical protein
VVNTHTTAATFPTVAKISLNKSRSFQCGLAAIIKNNLFSSLALGNVESSRQNLIYGMPVKEGRRNKLPCKWR